MKTIILLICLLFVTNARAIEIPGVSEEVTIKNATVNNGNLFTSDFLIEVAKGNVPGHSSVNKFGHNASADAGDDIWGADGVYGFYPTAAVAVDIKSSIDSDNGATATGAIQVLVQGLTTDWVFATETITIDGTAAVEMTTPFIRLFRAFVFEAGSNNTNNGNLTVYPRANGSGVTTANVGIYIGAGEGQTQQAIYTIPDGKTGYFLKGYVALNNDDKGGEDGTFQWLMRANNGVNGAWLVKGEVGLVNIGSSHWTYEYGIPVGAIPERTDIRIRLSAESDQMSTVAGFDLLLVDDGY